jgi:hypothetical protein
VQASTVRERLRPTFYRGNTVTSHTFQCKCSQEGVWYQLCFACPSKKALLTGYTAELPGLLRVAGPVLRGSAGLCGAAEDFSNRKEPILHEIPLSRTLNHIKTTQLHPSNACWAPRCCTSGSNNSPDHNCPPGTQLCGFNCLQETTTVLQQHNLGTYLFILGAAAAAVPAAAAAAALFVSALVQGTD